MYEEFYGLKEKPFSMLPDPGFLFLSKKHQAALSLLEYGILNHVGFCVISGEAGAGKTTILRTLLDRVDSTITVGLITNTHQSFGGLLDWILSVFDLHQPNLTHVEMHQIFMEYLIEEYANNRSVLLIVDEAQNMKAGALEELRMLSNVNSEKDQLLQVVLAGQPALKDTLRLPELTQFAQRIAVDYNLEPLSLEETCGYIQHRLITAGAQNDIFTPAACERIHSYSGGTPRLINLLCETVMVYGFADQNSLIDVVLVDEMVQERMKDSLVPIQNRDIATRNTESKLIIKDFPWIQPGGGTQGLKPDVNTTKDEASSQNEKAVKPAVVAKPATCERPLKKSPDEIKSPVRIERRKNADTGITHVEAQKARVGIEGRGRGVLPEDVIIASPVRASTDAPAKVTVPKSGVSKNYKRIRPQLIKYAIIGSVVVLFMIVVALLANDQRARNAAEIAELQEQQEREAEQLKKSQDEAARIKNERDEMIAKVKKEVQSKKEAALKSVVDKPRSETEDIKDIDKESDIEEEKRSLQAKEKAREQAKEQAREKSRERAREKVRERAREKAGEQAKEKVSVQAGKQTGAQARREKQAESKARLEAKRLEEKLAKERSLMRARLEEEMRLKRQEESLRFELELEALQRQREELLKTAREVAEPPAVVEEVVERKSVISAECTGPTARFKSYCR